jgi:UDP-N-acetylmuramoyl-L-alanyl-D-glutamate--2,6-diaminopimelate ligase
LGEDKDEVLSVISNLTAAEGRFDSIRSENQNITAIVDYAHTPDALEKVLQTLDKTRSGNENIITVVGCGGNRDKTKRPVMAKTACNYSDQVILTSDNPRNEIPESILEEMEQGIPPQYKLKTLIISDRKQAIRTACRLAKKGDIILVAGKGHEKYQEISGQKFPFDDKEELKSALAELNL